MLPIPLAALIVGLLVLSGFLTVSYLFPSKR